jgi:hypothetical protein
MITEFPVFYGNRRSIIPATVLYPEPDESIPYTHTRFFKFNISIILLLLLLIQVALSFQASAKNVVRI